MDVILNETTMETNNPHKENKYNRAKERVTTLRDFYTHLIIYLLFIPFIIWINWISSDFFWAIYPIAGWGIGVAGHAADTFGMNFLFGKKWEERKIKELMDKDRY